MMLQMQHIKTEGQHECSIKGDCAAFTDHRRTKKTEHHIQLSGSNTERNQNAAPRSRREARRKEKHKWLESQIRTQRRKPAATKVRSFGCRIRNWQETKQKIWKLRLKHFCSALPPRGDLHRLRSSYDSDVQSKEVCRSWGAPGQPCTMLTESRTEHCSPPGPAESSRCALHTHLPEPREPGPGTPNR